MQPYTFSQMLDRLGLEYTRKNNLNCPFCGEQKRHLHFDEEMGAWKCPKCGQGGYMLHFFSLYVLGQELPRYATKQEKSMVWREMNSFMGGEDRTAHPSSTARPAPPKVRRCRDDRLNEVYEAMLTLPALQLQPVHRRNLIKRGLTAAAIERNGYRSIPENIPDAAQYLDLYQREGGDDRTRESFGSWRPPKLTVIGLMIGVSLTNMGYDLDGVPGFFKFGKSWCCYCVPGILIPTRNMHGQIVICQIRLDTGNLRYMTMHRGDLPGAVTETVSRCHFPLQNPELDGNTTVIFTEGPLKADVAIHLMDKKVFFIAIPGTSNTKDLLNHVPVFRKAGVRILQDGLDMDKLTNPNVKRNCSVLTEEIEKRGVAVQRLYWDEDYARKKLLAFQALALSEQIPLTLPPERTVYEQLSMAADTLSSSGITPCKVKIRGVSYNLYWDPETKRIDDFYLRSRKR